MKKLMTTILAVLLLCGALMTTPIQAQAPKTFAFGTLLSNDGTKDFGWFYGGSFGIIEDSARGLSNYGRVGYFRTYAALNSAEAQSAAGWNMTQKDIGKNLYIATKLGVLFDFEQGSDDNVNAGVGLEVGWKLGGIAIVGLGADFQPVSDGVDKEFLYAIFNLFP
jgi:hypothetical protein